MYSVVITLTGLKSPLFCISQHLFPKYAFCVISPTQAELTKFNQDTLLNSSSIVMATTALRRLMAEYKQLRDNPPEGLMAGPTSEDNFFEWEAAVTGPEKCPFEDGVFLARISFPKDYPLNPPKMR